LHSFIFAGFEKRNTLTKQTVKKAVLIKSPDGKRTVTLRCPKVRLNLSGVDFRANLLVLNSSSIDLTLEIDWLTAQDAVIQYASRIVLMRTESREMMEVKESHQKSHVDAQRK
jgi:hypothetical protein